VPASSFSSHTSDLDEARALCHRYYYPITLDPLRGNSRLAFSFRVMELGPVTIGDLRYGCDMRVTCGDLVTSYHVNIPFSGQLDGFRRYVGMAPMTYLRHLRLARVHEELRLGDPRSVTVAEVASRWGFGHLGRFAAAYRAKYGVAPSVTLRSPG
jgi:hypothetical protein